ncbi:indole-3-glycerol phosphate synthase TrpC [Parvicella tangerina]|uniref:indole-3-glycerol-phosphate synthase n=1 Tax=Parvicella tangerina TaxID=2829795 RepID=A0A916NCW5_9FLAO|nr:indole-3-glycerol phosphate synthase TrpC [Parvicella tangerina]CAG5083913.1 Indole-3-glycerol phosphate synthase [Parvicella tangerina]
MNILDKIAQHKRKEVAERKSLYPIQLLEKSIYFDSPTVKMTDYLTRKNASGIIAEFKRQSPSKGAINPYANPEEVPLQYMQAGASALSVLTDNHFFGAKNHDLETARKFNYCPILRKDFMLDEYQIVEAKAMGADCILLIAKMISPAEVKHLADFAKSLDLQVLLEIHNENEIKANEDASVDLIGINNRNLDTFEVSIEHSIRLAELLPKELIKIAESGINDPNTVNLLKKEGFDGFLIGEYFMKNSNPGEKCQQFIKALNHVN